MNRDRTQKSHEYWLRNREHLNELRRIRRANQLPLTPEQREQERARGRAYYQRHKERRREYMRIYQARVRAAQKVEDEKERR